MRQEFPAKVREDAYARADGKCEVPWCAAPLQKGKFTYDHIIPDWMGGQPTLSNCQVICWACDKAKTKTDHGNIAKTKRLRRNEIKAGSRKGRPMPGTKASGIRKRMDGTVERW